MELINLQDINNININIKFGNISINVLYMHYGFFHSSVKEHIHSNNCYEIHLITVGEGTLIANNKKYEIKPNSLFVTGPNIFHEQITNLSNPMFEYCICFQLSKIKFMPISEESMIYEKISNIFMTNTFWFGQDTQNILDLICKLDYELKNKNLGYYINVKNFIEEFIVSLVRNYEKSSNCVDFIPTKSIDDKRLSLIDDFFMGSYENITLTELSKKICLSTRQTERIIEKYYGLSFNEKKLNAKMSAIASLLTTTSYSISKISELTGFSSLEHLSAAFKKHYNISASAYRKAKKITSS